MSQTHAFWEHSKCPGCGARGRWESANHGKKEYCTRCDYRFGFEGMDEENCRHVWIMNPSYVQPDEEIQHVCMFCSKTT
jgi:uncharacterized paraquat-inducible protein A